jgi:antitoxin component of MazEF toxin-antitoxin module
LQSSPKQSTLNPKSVLHNHNVITLKKIMQTHIVQIGNSLGLRLPKAVLSSLGLQRDSILSIRTKAGGIVLTPIATPRATWQAAFLANPPDGAENLWGDIPLAEGWTDGA